MSLISDDAPSSAWPTSDSESIQSASVRSTAPSYLPTPTPATSRFYSFRTAIAHSSGSEPNTASSPALWSASCVRSRGVLAGAVGDMDAGVDGGRQDERRVREGVAILERHPDLMCFFFDHVTGCPPRGPFRYYAALTFVQRARLRYGLDSPPTTFAGHVGDDGNDTRADQKEPADTPTAASLVGYCVSAEPLREALTVTNVLALMEVCFDTRHLKGWELLYVPAEVRSTDVEALLEQKRQDRLSAHK